MSTPYIDTSKIFLYLSVYKMSQNIDKRTQAFPRHYIMALSFVPVQGNSQSQKLLEHNRIQFSNFYESKIITAWKCNTYYGFESHYHNPNDGITDIDMTPHYYPFPNVMRSGNIGPPHFWMKIISAKHWTMPMVGRWWEEELKSSNEHCVKSSNEHCVTVWMIF